MYVEGDIIPGVGQVDTNHCGLPWPCCNTGSLNGVVQIAGEESMFCDAISGEVLTEEELDSRLNNPKFDYEGKGSNCIEWRKKNQPNGPYMYKYVNCKPFWLYKYFIWPLKRFIVDLTYTEIK